jgi:AcrR family transcriptional regulator
LNDAPRKRVRKSKAIRRREIAEAALRIMTRHGYHGTSVERIARAVGISNSALYQHFRNREDVFLAASDILGERAHEWIVAPSGQDALRRLDKIAETHMSWASSHLESFVRPIFAFVSVSSRQVLETNTPRAVNESYRLLLSIVEEGQREGSIRSDVEAADVAWAVLMFAWAEDMALLARVQEVTQGGAARRNFARLLATYAPASNADPCNGDEFVAAQVLDPSGHVS